MNAAASMLFQVKWKTSITMDSHVLTLFLDMDAGCWMALMQVTFLWRGSDDAPVDPILIDIGIPVTTQGQATSVEPRVVSLKRKDSRADGG
jgi:hypothetical protein